MSSKKLNLDKARNSKKDEFYTRLEDVENELKHYDLSSKVVYCNCDDYRWSAFYKYFKDNFHSLGIKSLVATHYSEDNTSTLTVFDGVYEHTTPLKGDGSFDSEECLEVLQGVDVVITNPPFSLFRRFIDLLVESGKDFIVLGNMNAISYKNVFPLIKENRVRLGVNSNKTIKFNAPAHYKFKEGETTIAVPAIAWFTTLVHDSVPTFLELSEEYCPDKFPKFDNYNAINIDRTNSIPKDYTGVMGVPISFLTKYNPKQFTILGSQRWGKGAEMENIYCGGKPSVYEDLKAIVGGKEVYFRIFIQAKF